MKRKGLLILGISMLLIGALVAGCQGPAEDTTGGESTEEAAGGEKVLKVGVVAPYTGPSSIVGDEFKAAVTMAFDEIDWTIGDYTVEVVWVDEETDPEAATRAYEAAIVRDNITCGLLNWDASVAVALMDVSARYQVPHFFAMGTSTIVDDKYFSDPKYTYWMAKGWPTPSKLTISYVNALEDAIERGLWDPGERRVALFGTDDDWARGFAAAIGGQLEEAGWEIVTEEYVPIGETDFYPLLTKFQSLEVPLVAGTSSDAAGYTAMIKQTGEIGLNSLIVADGLGWVGEWYSLTGPASNYVIDQIPGWTSPEAAAFHDTFTERFGFEPSPSAAGLAYDETRFFIKIAQRAYELHGELTRETLYQTGMDELITGKLTFTDGILMQEYRITSETVPDFEVGPGYFVFPVIQYFDGESVVIFPPEAREADMAIPAGLQN